MSEDIGARGHPNKRTVGKGPDFVAIACSVLYPGRAVDALTDPEWLACIRMARAELRELGLWPDSLVRQPPVTCKRGHEHPHGYCKVCQKIEKEQEDRTKAVERRRRARAEQIRRRRRERAIAA